MSKYIFSFIGIFGLIILSDKARADTMQIANNLGTVIGSEEYCGLSYNQSAIENFIEKNVSPSDMKFPSMLNMMIEGTKYSNKQRTPSAKTAHCSQIKRLAKSYNLID